MDDALLGLSWSAVLAGWPSLFLSVADVRALAESRLLEATGEALIPLSDLTGLSDDAARNEAAQALATLARLEGHPPYFALREWHLLIPALIRSATQRHSEFGRAQEASNHPDWSQEPRYSGALPISAEINICRDVHAGCPA